MVLLASVSEVQRSVLDPASRELIGRIAVCVAENHTSSLRVADLARQFHVSVRTLQNLFHAACGESPLRALRRFRLGALHSQLIARPWQSLRQAYDACGLTGSAADRELFREIYGVSIREHQQNCRDKRSAPSPLQAGSPVAAITALSDFLQQRQVA